MLYRIGMVLSGGGARGLGHVGVLKALAEEGIEPQVLAGTSAGAIVAALYAAGYSAQEMLEFFVDKNPLRVSKLSLVKPGIFDTEKVVADFLEYFPDDSFEALHKRIFLTATNIVEARPEIFASGRLIPAILASASTPLVFAPTEIDGRWYSDGGIINNFPVEPLLGLCDTILGVYASPLRSMREPNLGSSFAVAQRAFEIASYYSSKRKFHHCDLLLSPAELSAHGTFDTKHFTSIVEIGYRAARERMDEILDVVGRDRTRKEDEGGSAV
jgi:NTE family protein